MFVVPFGVYIFSKSKQDDRKIFLESLLWAIPASIVLDLFGHFNKAWLESTIFDTRFLNLMPYEGFLWGFSFIFFIVLFYEYFFDRSKIHHFIRRSYKFFALVFITALITLLVYMFKPHRMLIPYFYSILIGLFSLFDLVILWKYPVLIKKSITATVLLLPLFYAWEYTALFLNLWTFELGNHLYYFNLPFLPSTTLVPVEELVWFFVVTLAAILMHEFFLDNRK